jgi:uroporphyrinogen-III synthase
MQKHRSTILLIRPYEQSIVFAAEFLAETGSDVAIIPSPVLTIEPVLPLPDPEGAFALVFTSANAVRVFAQGGKGRGMRAYCVGASTANAARRAGFRAISADGDVSELLEMLTANHMEGDAPYLYLHGEKTAADLAGLLKERDIPVRARMVYRQVEQPLSDKARRVIASREVIVPLFSANSAEIFARQVSALPKNRIHFVCMSRAVAAALTGFAEDDIHFAAHPSRDGMIKAIAGLVLKQ